MMQKKTPPFNFMLIHSFQIDEKGNLTKIHQQRLDYGSAIYKKGLVKNVIVAGKLDNKRKEFFERTNVPLSSIMKEYLIKKGVPSSIIYEEPFGENTFECTVNSFDNIIIPKKWMSGVIVSSNEHLPRVIFQTTKIMLMKNIDLGKFQLFYSGPSIHSSGESVKTLQDFISHELEGIDYTLKKK